MSQIEANKRIASDFFYAVADRDLERLDQLLAKDLNYWAIGTLPTLSGDIDKTKIMGKIGPFVDLFGGTLRYEILGTIAEDDQVAVEARSHATMGDGREYRNVYHTIFKIQDGRITGIREYFDTVHAREMLT